MANSIWTAPLEELSAQVARGPVPAAVSVSAVCAVLALDLATMAIQVSARRSRTGGGKTEEIVQRLGLVRARLQRAADEDTSAYNDYLAQRRQAKSKPQADVHQTLAGTLGCCRGRYSRVATLCAGHLIRSSSGPRRSDGRFAPARRRGAGGAAQRRYQPGAVGCTRLDRDLASAPRCLGGGGAAGTPGGLPCELRSIAYTALATVKPVPRLVWCAQPTTPQARAPPIFD